MADRRLCKYVEICGLSEHAQSGADSFCILHIPPSPPKDAERFNAALTDYVERGGSDFRWMYFEQGWASLEGRRFAGVVDFRDATVQGTLTLTGVTCDRDIVFGGTGIQNVDLSRATVHGDLSFSGRIDNTLRLLGATISGATILRFDTSVHVHAEKADFHDNVILEAAAGSVILGLGLQGAVFRRGLTLRGTVGSQYGPADFREVTVRGPLALAGADFDGPLAFPEARFDTGSTLDLRGARIRGSFTLADLAVGPKTVTPERIFLDGTRFDGPFRIEAPARGPKPRVVAAERRPIFGQTATFANVDLADCLLVGNVLANMEFWNVDWSRRRGRCVLCDEIVYRRTWTRFEGVPASNLREAYQVLKQKYQGKGDHVRAGDFHYGEMEMKRREYDVPRRWLSWEFAYWMLSGYGVGHVRSLAILVGFIIGFAGVYHITKPTAFSGFGEALRYSIGVAALQRPEMPKQFDELQKWLHVAQSVFGPLQIALFMLALRMRLKR